MDTRKNNLPAPPPHEYDCTLCPCCGKSQTMEGQVLSPGDNAVFYDMLCKRCGASWTEEYALVGYRSLTDEEGEEIAVPSGPNKIEALEQHNAALLAALRALTAIVNGAKVTRKVKQKHLTDARAAIAKAEQND